MSDLVAEPVSKAEAIRIGARHYHTASPCGRGHTAPRYTRGGACVECVRISRGGWLKTRKRSSINMEEALRAKAEGKTTYLSHRPCPKGHVEKFVASNNCVQCNKEARARDKIKRKFARIRKEYGLSNRSYLDLVKAQQSSCKICGKHETDHHKLHIDHCHESGIVRGLLCGPCNQGIGLFKHSRGLLDAAIQYLVESKK